MNILLNIKELIEEVDDEEYILDESVDIRSITKASGKFAYKTIKSVAKGSLHGIKGVKSWIDYLNSIERYKLLISKTQDRISANTNDDREKILKDRLDKLRYKLKRIQLKEQNKKADFIADTEVKIQQLNDLKQSNPDSSDIPELEELINTRKQFLSKIGYGI